MRKLLVSVVLLAAAVAVGYWWLQDQFYAPGPSTDIVRIQVEQGESVRTVLAQLAKLRAVRQPRAAELYLRIARHTKGHQPRIQVGMYEIPAGSSPAQILELFDQGRVVLEQLTIVEGSRFADFRHLLDNHADLYAKDHAGDTAFEIAKKSKNEVAAELLAAATANKK